MTSFNYYLFRNDKLYLFFYKNVIEHFIDLNFPLIYFLFFSFFLLTFLHHYYNNHAETARAAISAENPRSRANGAAKPGSGRNTGGIGLQLLRDLEVDIYGVIRSVPC